MLPVTALFAGLFTLLFVRLAFAVIRLRRANRVALGAGGVSELEGAVRAHGNFAEYVPLGLILMGLAEASGHHPLFVIVPGAVLLAGRIIHGKALQQGNLSQRVTGMKWTFASLISLAVLNVVFAVIAFVG